MTSETTSKTEYQLLIISKIIDGINKNINTILIDSLGRLIIDEKIGNDFPLIVPYLYAVGFLSLMGKQIDKDSLKNLLVAAGVKPTDERIEKIIETGIRTRIPYMYAAYFLIILGKPVNAENIRSVCNAIGEKDDEEAINEILYMYNKKIIP
ncbi:MAG: hypothetical protein ACP5M9_01215 [Candidatus Micrarchaeia archaeon]